MKTTNVTVKTHLGCSVNLKHLCKSISNTVYNPSRFPALRIEHRSCTSKCIVFRTGYVFCHGSNYQHARSNVRKYTRMIQKRGYPVKLSKISIISVSVTHDIGLRMDYTTLKETFHTLSYEPEIFASGASLKLGRIHVNIFKNGKITAVGLKSEVVPRCLKNLISTLESQRVSSP